MERFLKLISETLYTLPIMVLLQLVVVIASLKNRKRFSELRYFHFYPIAGLIQTITFITSAIYVENRIKFKVIESSINIFTILEVILIYHLGFQIIKVRKLRNVLIFFLFSFFLYALLTWGFTNAFLINSSRMFPIESLVVLIPTCFYFFQLFKLPPTFNLFNQPAFWINIGILFAFSCTLPLSTLEFFNKKFIDSNFYFYYINFISYSFLYLSIAKGYCCRKKSSYEFDTEVSLERNLWKIQRP